MVLNVEFFYSVKGNKIYRTKLSLFFFKTNVTNPHYRLYINTILYSRSLSIEVQQYMLTGKHENSVSESPVPYVHSEGPPGTLPAVRRKEAVWGCALDSNFKIIFTPQHAEMDPS